MQSQIIEKIPYEKQDENNEEEEELVMPPKKKGFKRTSPVEEAEKIVITETFKCEDCGETFVSVSQKKSHKKEKHKEKI